MVIVTASSRLGELPAKLLNVRKQTEERFNSFPQWTTDVEDLKIHFLGLFSEKKDAIPILLIHGWPGK